MSSLPEQFSETDRSLLAAYWKQRAIGEYTSFVAFQQIRRDLVSLGAHAETLDLATRAVADELAHAGWCRDWALRFGHAPFELETRCEDVLTFEGAPEGLQPLLRVAFCCLTETLGCFVLQAQRPYLTHSELRRLNQRHLADEIQHSRVGWSFLASLTLRQREQLRPWLRPLCSLLTQVAEDGSEGNSSELLAGGYFTKGLLSQACRDALGGVILPGFVTHQLMEAA